MDSFSKTHQAATLSIFNSRKFFFETMLRLKFILLAFFSLVVLFLQAQSNSILHVKRCPIKTLNFETGLQNNGSTHIITDRLGFTWVSTRTGLQRYNGYTLETITPIAGKDTFRINNPVYFFELHDGTIWISFKQTVLKYDYTTNSFGVVVSLPSAGLAPFAIVPLKETKEGIWCMQETKGIVMIDRNGKLLQQFNFFNPSLTDGILNSPELLYQDKITHNERQIFIAQSGSGNNSIFNDINNGNVLTFNTEGKKIRQLKFPGNNIMGLTCGQKKLYVLTKDTLFLISIDDYTINKRIPLTSVTAEKIIIGSLRFGSNNGMMLAINNHLFEMDAEGNYLYELTDLNRNPAVAAGFIHQIYPDRFKRIWLISNNDIKRIENIEIPFEHFIYSSEKDNFIRSIYYDTQKKVLIAGCFYSGIQLYDSLGNPLLEKTISSPLLKNIICIEKISDDEYLVLTLGGGWYLFNLSTHAVKLLKIPAAIQQVLRPTQMNFPNNIRQAGNDALIITTANNVFRCRIAGPELISAEPLLPELAELKNAVGACMYDSYKNVWAGTYNGKIIRITPDKKSQTFSLPYQYGVRCFAEDEEHNIWVGTEKGLYVFSVQGKLLKEFTHENGLRNDCIYAILPLDNGTAVFASTNLGLSLISIDGTIKNFSKEMGLQENEFNTGAALKTSSGKFYFGGINGITAFYPASLSAISDTPSLYITRLVVNDSLYNSSAGTWQGDSILLNYTKNRLRFDIAAIGLLNTNEYVYQYRMANFENAWQTTYQPAGINYTLDPGKYELEIICHPILSSAISFKKTFVIRILPPWWQTWWFRILAAALLIAIVIYVVHSYNRRKYVKKIQELETRNKIQLEKERISRDLHDNLGVQANAILHNSTLLSGEKSDIKNIVTDLQETAKEMLHNLRETLWAMKTSDVTAKDVWLRIINFMKQMGRHYTTIHFKVEGEVPKNFIIASNKALNIVLVLQESVNNAVKHAGATTIMAACTNNNNEWVITISDDGKGFDMNTAKEKTDSYGLQNMQERALSGNFKYAIETVPGKGTKTIISIAG
jgi:two-component sensor histidine kinase/ligand-binding sensor domain-containing protein